MSSSLTSLGILPQQIVWGVGEFMWDVQPHAYISIINRELITKDLILRMEYRGMRKTSVAVYEVPALVKGEALAAYFKQFRQIISVFSDHKLGE